MIVGEGGSLFLSAVPEPPGDPAALARAAGIYTAAQGEIQRNHAVLTAAVGQTGGVAWQGTGAARFITAAQQLAAVYSLTAGALARGATTLRTFSTDLATAKATARAANAAVATSNASASALLAAEGNARQTQSDADNAAQEATTAEAQASANPHSPSAKVAADNARSASNDAQNAASAAAAQLSNASAQYSADSSRAIALTAEAQRQATQAADKAAAGFDAAAIELAGVKLTAAHGGATGVPGGSPWHSVIAWLDKKNDQAGWVLNVWGLQGAYVLLRSGGVYADRVVGAAEAARPFDELLASIMAGQGGFFRNGSDGFYAARDAYNAALSARSAAKFQWHDAVSPSATDWGFGANFARVGLGAAMISDTVTAISPGAAFGPDHVFGGEFARSAAIANFAASGVALTSSLGWGVATAALAIPGANVVVAAVIIGTSAYFAGQFVYQHWHTIAHLGADAWHGVDDAYNWGQHTLNDIGNDVSSAFSWL
jgi:hypothetical protein